MANTIKLKRSSVAGKVPTTSDLALGELGLNTHDGKLFAKKSVSGTESIVDLSGGGTAAKSITLVNPTNSENLLLFFTDKQLSLSQIRSVLAGSGSPSVTFSLRYGGDVSASGTEVVTGGITCTNTTTGLSTTSFDNGTIAANSFVWLTTSAVSGSVDSLHLSITFV